MKRFLKFVKLVTFHSEIVMSNSQAVKLCEVTLGKNRVHLNGDANQVQPRLLVVSAAL